MTHRGAFIVSTAEGLALLAAAGAASRCHLRVRQRLHRSAQVLQVLVACGWARRKLPVTDVPGFGSSEQRQLPLPCIFSTLSMQIAIIVRQWCCACMATQYYQVPGQCKSSGTCELLRKLLIEAGTSAAHQSGLPSTTPENTCTVSDKLSKNEAAQ